MPLAVFVCMLSLASPSFSAEKGSSIIQTASSRGSEKPVWKRAKVQVSNSRATEHVTWVAKPSKSKKATVKKSSAKKLVKTPSKTKVKVSVKKKKWTPKVRSKIAPEPVFVPRETIREVNSPTDSNIERASITTLSGAQLRIPELPQFNTAYRGNIAALSPQSDFIQFSLDKTLQDYTTSLVSQTRASHVAAVVMDPLTGRILAMAGKSPTVKNIVLHSGFPAASLFKVITSTAALEQQAILPDSLISYRGGVYELSEYNYRPNPVRDNRVMPVGEALGRSCNPVFGRIAFNYLNATTLRYYANMYGFNSNLGFQTDLSESRAFIPNDPYEFSRTAAGFGEVFINPVHAAALMSAVANGGNLPRPYFVDQVINKTGDVIYKTKPIAVKQVMNPKTADTLMQMMIHTTTIGTSKREFKGKFPYTTSAKTGTLRGDNPKGLNNWFIGAAPTNSPKAVVSVIVVNPTGASSKASHLGRLLLEKAL